MDESLQRRLDADETVRREGRSAVLRRTWAWRRIQWVGEPGSLARDSVTSAPLTQVFALERELDGRLQEAKLVAGIVTAAFEAQPVDLLAGQQVVQPRRSVESRR